MSGIRVEGNTSGNVAEVSPNNQLLIQPPTVMAQAGYEVIVSEVDPGTIIGSPTRRTPNASRDDRLSSGLDTGLFDYLFNAGAQDTGVWKYAFTTMTITQSGGTALFNANSTATTTTGCSLSTWRYFDLAGHGGIRVKAVFQFVTNAFEANQVFEWGLFTSTQTTAPTDGVYFRITSAGVIGVINFNGVETPTSVFEVSPTINEMQSYQIDITVRGVEFWIDGVLYGVLLMPAGNAQPFLEGAQPLTFQQRNSGAVVGAQAQIKLGRCHATYLDMQLAMPFSHQQVGGGLTVQQGIAGGTMGSAAFLANNLAAGAGAAMTNTTAALGAGLGGQFACQPTLAVPTDGIVCSFQNPQGSVTQKPRVLMITGVKIMSVVTTVMVGGPFIWVYSLAFGHTAVSMATAESASFTGSPSTKAPRRVVLGIETMAAAAAVGVVGSPEGIYQAFNSPIPVNPGEFIAVCAKNLGVVSTSGVVQFLVTFDGYWV